MCRAHDPLCFFRRRPRESHLTTDRGYARISRAKKLNGIGGAGGLVEERARYGAR